MPASALNHLGRVTANTRRKAEEILAAAEAAGHRIDIIYGYNPASKPEHSSGLAVDFMVHTRAAGDFISDYVWTHRKRLGLRWVIWWQRVRSTTPGKGDAWRPMADRGNRTQNHMDHPHIFFTDSYSPPTQALPKPQPGPEAARAWWGERPYPQPPAFLSVRHLRAAIDHDEKRSDQGLYHYADQVWVAQQALGELGHMRFGTFVAGHAGVLTRAGIRRFQQSLGHPVDGWLGPKELAELMRRTGRNFRLEP